MTGRYAIVTVSILVLGMMIVPVATAQDMMFAEGTTFIFPEQNVSIELGQDYEWNHITRFPDALRVDDAYIEVTTESENHVHVVLNDYNLSSPEADPLFEIHIDGTRGDTARFRFTDVPEPLGNYRMLAAGEPGRMFHSGNEIVWEYTFGPPTTFTLIHEQEETDETEDTDEDDPDPVTPPEEINDTDDDTDTAEDDPDEDGPDPVTSTGENGEEEPGDEEPDDPDEGSVLEGTVLYAIAGFIVIGFLLIGCLVGYRMVSGKKNRAQQQQQQQQYAQGGQQQWGGQQYRQQQWSQDQQRGRSDFRSGGQWNDQRRRR